jgi:hypothetical protein
MPPRPIPIDTIREKSDWELFETIFGKAPVVSPEAAETFENLALLTEIGSRILTGERDGQRSRPQDMRTR